jgi:hypothetical protein
MLGRRRRKQAQAAEEAAAAQAPPEEAAPVAEAPPAASAAPEQPAYMVELEQLNQLKAQGVITDEEFEAKKAQILGL